MGRAIAPFKIAKGRVCYGVVEAIVQTGSRIKHGEKRPFWPVMGKNGAVNRNRFYLYTSKYYYSWGRCIIGADIYY